jgi:hypothetical protein
MRKRNSYWFLYFIFAYTWSFVLILYVAEAAAIVVVVVVLIAVAVDVDAPDLALQSVPAAVDRYLAEARASKDLQCPHLRASGERTESTGSDTGDAGGSEGGNEGRDRAWRGPSSLDFLLLRLHSCHRLPK